MRVLYLAHRIPDAPTKGDKIRSFHQVQALCQRHEVHVLTLDDEPHVPKHPVWADAARLTTLPLHPGGARRRALWALCTGGSLSAAHFAEPALARSVRRELGEGHYDVAVVYSGAMDPLVRGFRPRVLDLVDVDSEKFAIYHRQGTVAGLKRHAFGLEGKRLRRLETSACADADLTLLCTEAEAQTLRSFARPRRLEVLGNGVERDRFPFGDDSGREQAEILFVGALDYQANIDAAEYLVRDLFPAIRRQVPDAAVTLVGRQPSREVQTLAQEPGVELHADVESVLPFLHRATVTLLPFRVARGVQNKALEALAAGLPVVASSCCAEGLAGATGEDYLAAPDTEGLVRETVRVLQSPDLRQRLASRGHDLVRERYSWDGILTRFLELVEEVASTSRPEHRTGVPA